MSWAKHSLQDTLKEEYVATMKKTLDEENGCKILLKEEYVATKHWVEPLKSGCKIL